MGFCKEYVEPVGRVQFGIVGRKTDGKEERFNA